ncbi:MAG: acetyl-CoA carboxylase, carboxyltransferase subunit beta [Eubacteriaceae bacterium]|jgi:acetyl-CoA carboxylase carboxyl transferase subunit beta|nr:acetyl-CoA carboxylase, carboxyltransferase subunit beta [Eubacteriaceae bacterium]
MNPLFKKRRDKIFQLKALREKQSVTTMPDAIPVQQKTIPCPACGHALTLDELEKTQHVCRCGHHFPIGAHYRLQMTMDPGTIREMGQNIKPWNWLSFPGYPEKLEAAQKKSGNPESVVTVRGKIGGFNAVVAVMDTRFMMGSMGTATGERITQAIELADRKQWPLILFCASGGARMQEGIMSLMQMAKTSAALERFSQNGGLSVCVLTHPTTGGVTASFAMLGDITLAEPGALIGFAGPRVIEQTIGETLPEGFQRSAFQMDHGFVDQVVERRELRDVLIRILRLHTC